LESSQSGSSSSSSSWSGSLSRTGRKSGEDREEVEEEEEQPLQVQISSYYAEGATAALELVFGGGEDSPLSPTSISITSAGTSTTGRHTRETYYTGEFGDSTVLADEEESEEDTLLSLEDPTLDDLTLTDTNIDASTVSKGDDYDGHDEASVHDDSVGTNNEAISNIDRMVQITTTAEGINTHLVEIDDLLTLSPSHHSCSASSRRHNGDTSSQVHSITGSTDETPTSPKMSLLIHGILPSGRPLEYNRKENEPVILKGVLPSGRSVDIDERDANIMRQTLSFDAHSPRGSHLNVSSPVSGRGASSVSAVGDRRDTATNHNFACQDVRDSSNDCDGPNADVDASRGATPGSKKTPKYNESKLFSLEETPLVSNKNTCKAKALPHSGGQELMLSDEVPPLLQMTFPLELADDQLMENEREERDKGNARNKKKRKKRKKRAQTTGSSSSSAGTTETDVSGLLSVENSKVMASYLNRMAVFDAAQREGGCSILQKETSEKVGDYPGSSPSVSKTTIDAKHQKEAELEAILVEPKKELRNLLKLIAGDTTPEADSSNDEDTQGYEEKQETDDFAKDEDWYYTSRHADILRLHSVGTDKYEHLKQDSVRRENACGALRFMASTASTRYILGRTRGVIPALSDALVDVDASNEQRIRCINTLILLSQDPNVRAFMLKVPSLPAALKKAAIDESAQVRNLVCVCLSILTKDKPNRPIIGEIFLDAAVHILDLASAFDDVQPRSKNNIRRRLRGRQAADDDDDEEAIPGVLSDMTMESLSHNDVTCVVGNKVESKQQNVDREMKTAPTHEVYFQARSHALKVLLDLSNTPHLTKDMARHEALLATLIRLEGALKAADNMLIMAIVTNLTRHSGNATLLAGNSTFVSALIRAVGNATDEECRKCALYALRNLATESDTHKNLITNEALFQTLGRQYSTSSDVDTRIAILSVLQNLSNDAAFLLMVPCVPTILSDLIQKSNAGESDVETHMACDIMATLSKWMWSANYTGAQAKDIQLGGNGGNDFGFKTPAKPFLSTRAHDQWV